MRDTSRRPDTTDITPIVVNCLVGLGLMLLIVAIWSDVAGTIK